MEMSTFGQAGESRKDCSSFVQGVLPTVERCEHPRELFSIVLTRHFTAKIIVLSDEQLNEYLADFDWAEIEEYGDENIIEFWGIKFDRPSTTTALNSGDNDGTIDFEAATEGGLNGDLDRNCCIAGEGTAIANNPDNCLPFTTPRLGTHADTIAVADRQPYPEENDPVFHKKNG
ncbi:hypothetical protein L915_08448 [Phytophthora nicotianae]|uniref:Uncharacterized protein n=1 Tax=Phytophthora nicotianae TaxID=4792 RepID=W2GXJ1_PHYNI|nr:hypothetical protein L915_08448 [Phytophthora nicotianae]ETL40440.1 hypothetical protein L916_08376 [Phytophthora nicotianae]